MPGLNVPIDGFTLSAGIRYTPYNYVSMALGEMDVLRRANRYRMRILAYPDSYNQPLQPYETMEFQGQVAGGSFLWGVLFNQFDAGWALVAPANILWSVTEACNGLRITSDFAGGQGFTGFTAGNTPLDSGLIPVLLARPRLFLEPGNINVELSNIGTTTQRCQILLHFAEPCTVIASDIEGGTRI